jgi:hypothetical protein
MELLMRLGKVARGFDVGFIFVGDGHVLDCTGGEVGRQNSAVRREYHRRDARHGG